MTPLMCRGEEMVPGSIHVHNGQGWIGSEGISDRQPDRRGHLWREQQPPALLLQRRRNQLKSTDPRGSVSLMRWKSEPAAPAAAHNEVRRSTPRICGPAETRLALGRIGGGGLPPSSLA